MNPHPELLKVYREEFYDKIQEHLPVLATFEEKFKTTDLYRDVAKDDFEQNREKYWREGIRDKHISSVIGSALGYKKVNGLKLLDAGCGIGDYDIVLKSLGYDVEGFIGGKFFMEDFEYIHKLLNLNVKYGDLKQTLPYTNDTFDIVFCCLTLSLKDLIKQYSEILSEFRRITKPRGKIIIVTHQNRHKEKFLKFNVDHNIKDKRIVIKSWSECKWRHEPTLEVETLE